MGYEKDIFGSFAYDFERTLAKTYIRLIIYADFYFIIREQEHVAGDYATSDAEMALSMVFDSSISPSLCYQNIFSHSDSSAFCITEMRDRL